MNYPHRFAATLAAMGLMVAVTPVASAHDVVLDSTPADGGSVSEFPDSVALEFSGIPREGFNTFAVSDVDSGDVLFSGEPTIDGRTLSLDLPEDLDTGPGSYQIGFQITSSDGHSTRGRTSFTVAGERAGAEETGEKDAADQAADSANSVLQGPVGIIGVIGAIVALSAVVVLTIRKGKMSRELDEHLRNQHPDNGPDHT